MTTDHTPDAEQAAIEERVARRLAGAWITDDDWQRYDASLRADYLTYAREVIALVREEPAAVLPPPVPRADVLREAADAIDAETRQAKADGVLEPNKYRPCRDASAQLRRMADEAQPATETPADAERCIHVRAVHTRHHHQPVTGCPWCAAREQP